MPKRARTQTASSTSQSVSSTSRLYFSCADFARLRRLSKSMSLAQRRASICLLFRSHMCDKLPQAVSVTNIDDHIFGSLGPSVPVTHRESLCPVASKFFFFSCEFHPIIYQCGNEAKLQHAKNSANTLIGSACCSEKSRLRRPRFAPPPPPLQLRLRK
jgi:hypothetical protein